MDNLFYNICRAMLGIIFKICFCLRIEGREHIVKGESYLIAANHASYLDPPLMACAWPVPMYFMARETLFRQKFFAWLIRNLHAIPVKRGESDRKAMQAVVALLQNGESVLVFPEGTRTLNGELLPGNPGFGLLALRAQRPIMPIFIRGSYAAWPKGRGLRRVPITVVIGQPLLVQDFPDVSLKMGDQARQLTDTVMQRIQICQNINKLS